MSARGRAPILSALVITAVFGLASRTVLPLPAGWGKELGNVLWAMAWYWLVALIWPRWSWRQVTPIALGLAFATELLQLVQTDWLAALRRLPVIGMLLGSGFSWLDMSMYVVGVAVAAGGHVMIEATAPAGRDRSAP